MAAAARGRLPPSKKAMKGEALGRWRWPAGRPQLPHQPLLQRLRLPAFALPDGHHPPARRRQGRCRLQVSLHVPRKLHVPVGRVRPWTRPKLAGGIGVLMPKAAVDLHDRPPLREDEVWPPRQSPYIRTEAVAQSVKKAANKRFGPRACATVSPHHGRHSEAGGGWRPRDDDRHCDLTPRTSKWPTAKPAGRIGHRAILDLRAGALAAQ